MGLGVRVMRTLWTLAGAKLCFLSQSSRGPLERCSPDTALFMALVYSRTPKFVCGKMSPKFIVSFGESLGAANVLKPHAPVIIAARSKMARVVIVLHFQPRTTHYETLYAPGGVRLGPQGCIITRASILAALAVTRCRYTSYCRHTGTEAATAQLTLRQSERRTHVGNGHDEDLEAPRGGAGVVVKATCRSRASFGGDPPP